MLNDQTGLGLSQMPHTPSPPSSPPVKGAEAVHLRILPHTREVVYKHSMHMSRALQIANDLHILILIAKFSEYLKMSEIDNSMALVKNCMYLGHVSRVRG